MLNRNLLDKHTIYLTDLKKNEGFKKILSIHWCYFNKFTFFFVTLKADCVI